MNKKNAFVIMPFSEDLSDVYDFLIRDGLEASGYDVKRADDIRSQNNILEDIVTGIVKSDLIVADLTDSNPNVYYELGIAHALQKNVILITQDIDELPFDLRSYRVICYKTHFTRMNQAKNELISLSKDAFSGVIPFGNPVKDFKIANPMTSPCSTFAPESGRAIEHDEDKGILDYKIELEEGLERLTDIVVEVGEKLSNELTPEIVKSGEIVKSDNVTSKQQRNSVKILAKHMDNFALHLKPRNEEYRKLLLQLETCFEQILSDEIDYSDPDSQVELKSFLGSFEAMMNGARQGRIGFASMLNIQKGLPRLEKSFNRSNRHMQEEVSQFVDNIDQTISVVSRALNLGKMLLISDDKSEIE